MRLPPGQARMAAPTRKKPPPAKKVVKKTKAKAPAKDPFAALAPLSAKQIATRARADVYPAANAQIGALTAELGRKTKAGMGAIGGYANQLANALGGYAGTAQNIYGGAINSQAAVDAALAGRLTGQGNQLGDELAAKLGAINAPGAQVQDVAGGARQIGQTSGNTQFALGSNELGRLVGESASSQNFAAKLPGIARFGGLAAGKELQLATQSDLADQSGKIRAQAASDYASAVKGYSSDEIDKALANLTQQGKNYAAEAGAQADAAKGRRDVAKVQQTASDKAADRDQKLELKKLEIASRERIAREKASATAAKTAASNAAKAQTASTKAAAKAAETAAKDKKAHAKDFYDARTKAFNDAATQIGQGHSPADVKAALEANYGRLLEGKGFSPKAIAQMIAAAIKAGQAAPKKPSKSSTTKTGASSGLVP